MSLFTELTSNEQASLTGGTYSKYYARDYYYSKSFNKVTGGAGGDAEGGVLIGDSKVVVIGSHISADTTGGAGGAASIS